MALEALVWPFPPVSPDNDDGGQAYNMGLKFHLLASELCHGVQWEVPDTVSAPPGGTHAASIWTVVGETRIAYVEFTPVPNTLQDILFAAPVALTAGDEYVVGLYTVHYSFSSPSPGSGWVLESPSLNVVSDESRLASYNGGAATAPYPSSNFNGWYYVSPLVDAPSAPASPVPDGVPIPVSLGTPAVGDASSPAPAGLAVPVALGTPTVGDASSPAPTGLAVPVTLGTPSVGDASSPAPTGLPVPVTLGTPSVGDASSPAPAGLPIPVTLGTPSVGAVTVIPSGLAIPVTLGTPAVGDASSPAPTGLAIPVTLGTPTLGASPHPNGLPIPVTLGTPGVGPTIPNLHLPPMTGTATVVSGLAGGATVLTLTGTATIQ